MTEEKLDHILASVEPSRRAILKKMLLAAGFVVPIIASFPVTQLAAAGMGSGGGTTSTTITGTP